MRCTRMAGVLIVALVPLTAWAEPANGSEPGNGAPPVAAEDEAPETQPEAQPEAQEDAPRDRPPPPRQPPPRHPPRGGSTTQTTTLTPGHRVSDGPTRRYRSHKPGLRIDAGFVGGNDTAMWGVGLGYMYALGYEFRPFGGEAEAVARAGAGPDLTMAVDADGLHGLAGFLSLRLTAVANRVGGLSLETSIGSGIGRGGIGPAGRLGLYLSGRYFEIGYFYQATLIRRLEWMRPHNLGIRLHIPIFSE